MCYTSSFNKLYKAVLHSGRETAHPCVLWQRFNSPPPRHSPASERASPGTQQTGGPVLAGPQGQTQPPADKGSLPTTACFVTGMHDAVQAMERSSVCDLLSTGLLLLWLMAGRLCKSFAQIPQLIFLIFSTEHHQAAPGRGVAAMGSASCCTARPRGARVPCPCWIPAAGRDAPGSHRPSCSIQQGHGKRPCQAPAPCAAPGPPQSPAPTRAAPAAASPAHGSVHPPRAEMLNFGTRSRD